MVYIKGDEILEKNLNEIIKEILVTEKKVLKCLNRFICNMLEEIYSDHCMEISEKVSLSSELIKAAARKEEGAAKVIKALSELLEKECTWMQPGESIPVCSGATSVNTIEFDAYTESGVSEVSALVNGTSVRSTTINTSKEHYNLPLGGNVQCEDLSLKNTGNKAVCIYNLRAYKQ